MALWCSHRPAGGQGQSTGLSHCNGFASTTDMKKPGYEIDKVKRFCDYAEYVLDLKERNGLAPTTIERYRAMLPRINDAIVHLKLTQIRPQHLNDFYKTLSENGVRNLGAIAVAKKVLKKKVEALGQPKHVIAKEGCFLGK